MIEVSDTHVTSVAEKAANNAGIVAVIHVKVSPAACLIRAATRTFTLLFGKHLLVSTERQTITSVQGVIFGGAGVSLAPSLRLGRAFFFVYQSPFLMALSNARFAVYVQAMERMITLMKLRARLGFVAPWAKFGRRINERFLNHLMLSLCINNTTLGLRASQGET